MRGARHRGVRALRKARNTQREGPQALSRKTRMCVRGEKPKDLGLDLLLGLLLGGSSLLGGSLLSLLLGGSGGGLDLGDRGAASLLLGLDGSVTSSMITMGRCRPCGARA